MSDYKKRKTRKKKEPLMTPKISKVGGGLGMNVPPAPRIMGGSAPLMAVKTPKGGSASAPAPAAAPPAPAPVPTLVPMNGGKLILAPKKAKSSVILAPRVKKTPVKTRKIHVQLSGLKKRLTRAKIIHKDSHEKPIEQIRKSLEEAKLIKPLKEGKSVPEPLLRSIHKDYLLLRNKAL